ncbi:MAG: restriction endonuclease subunit S, partial [Chitinophagaceae bacterium]
MVESIIKSFDIWTDAQGVKSKGRVKSIDNISLEGIAHLRKLILELAIRGKLVSQNPNDEPASELMKEIGKEKSKLLTEGKIKKQKVKSNEHDSTLNDRLPSNWITLPLSQVFDVRDGTHDSPKPVQNGYPLVTSKNLSSGKLDLSDVNYISERDHRKIIERSKVDKDDILFAMIGSIGNPVIVDTDIEFSIKNVALFKYYNKDLSSPKYLQLFLKHAATELKEKALGGVQSFVSLGILRDFNFPMPPLAEQYRIVAKVEELMALCDELEKKKTDSLKTHQTLVAALLQTLTAAKDAGEVEAAWHRLAPHFDTLFCTEDSIDQLKQTILQLAIIGRLVKQDPADEPARELLKKIAAEKEKLIKKGKIKKEKPLPALRDDEKAFMLPKGWEWVRLGDIAQLLGGFAYQSSKFVEDSRHQIIRMGNVRPDFLRLNENPVFISENQANDTSEYKV